MTAADIAFAWNHHKNIYPLVVQANSSMNEKMSWQIKLQLIENSHRFKDYFEDSSLKTILWIKLQFSSPFHIKNLWTSKLHGRLMMPTDNQIDL